MEDTLSGDFSNHSFLKEGDQVEILSNSGYTGYPPTGSVITLVGGSHNRLCCFDRHGEAKLTGKALTYRLVSSFTKKTKLCEWLKERGL